jgi:FkbM family methyltransferase
MKTAQFIDLLRFRLFWLKYGVAVVRSSGLHANKIKIGRNTIKLSVPADEEKKMNVEFRSIFYDDCYGLRKTDGQVNKILDVGGNVGFFSLAARSCFPEARIHSYEPNPQMQPHLLNNTGSLSIQVHPEAIGAQDGWIELDAENGSLLAKTVVSKNGHIKQTAMATAIARMGGSVDLLKLDCEGAEWELFADKTIWPSIRRLTMEYHLWASPGLDVPGLIRILRGFGFRITYLNEAPQLEWGILHATRI